MDLCACKYEVDDPNIGDLLGVLMTTTIMLVEVSDNIFPTLWWWWLTWIYLKPHQVGYSRFHWSAYMIGLSGKETWKPQSLSG